MTTLESIFAGLSDLNTGFDAPTISHLSPGDFARGIERCARRGVIIYGIEVFLSEDGKVSFLEVVINPGSSNGYSWAYQIAETYWLQPGITLSGTFATPEEIPHGVAGFDEALEDFARQQETVRKS